MNIRALMCIASIVALTFLVSCGGEGKGGFHLVSNNNNDVAPFSEVAPTDAAPYIMGRFISFQADSYKGNIPNASVQVQDPSSNADITTAIVSINNITLNYNPDSGHKAYEGNISVEPGEGVELTVTVRQKSYYVSLKQFTSYPTMSAPVASTLYSSIPNTIYWNGGTPITNAVHNLAVLDAYDPNGKVIWPMHTDNNFQVMPTSTTGYTFYANSITAGDRLLFIGIVRGELIPEAAYNSKFIVAGCSTIPITVVDATLQSIAVTPTNPIMPWGSKQQFAAIGTFSDNSSIDITSKVNWSTNGFSISTNNIVSWGQVIATSTGTSTVTASLNQISGSTAVNVLPPKLLSMKISPSNRSIVPETKQHFSVSGQYEDGYVRDITSKVIWGSSDTNVAMISNDSGSNGLANVIQTGTSTISATLNGVFSSTLLTVTNRPSISGNSVYLQSDTGDYIGGGGSYNLSDMNSTFYYSAVGGHLSLSTPLGNQTLLGADFMVPNALSQLQVGYYGNLTRYPFHDPVLGGLDWNMDHNGCNRLSGWFAIDSVTYSSGKLNGIDLRFEQHCEEQSPALYGWIHLGP